MRGKDDHPVLSKSVHLRIKTYACPRSQGSTHRPITAVVQALADAGVQLRDSRWAKGPPTVETSTQAPRTLR